MVQAKAFGDLRFEDEEHGWALEVGLFLGSWVLCHGPQLSDSQLQSNFRRHASMCKSGMIHRLQTHRINIEIPDYDSAPETSLVSIDHAILESVRTTWSPVHCAFVLVGKAASFFEWVDYLSDPRDIQEIHRCSKVAIGQLQQRCQALFPGGVQHEAIYEQLKRTKGDPWKVRQLLSDLRKPMIILLVLADPVDGGRLRLLKEQQQLTDSLRQSLHRDSFDVQVLADVTTDNFGPTLVRTKPTIVHFSGHGSRDGLFFSNLSGEATKVEPRHLSRLLSVSSQHNLQGVLLNACYTTESFRDQGDLDQQLILMEGPLDDSAAISFAQQFYAYLGEGLSFREAFTWAEASADLTGNMPVKAAFMEKEPGTNVRGLTSP